MRVLLEVDDSDFTGALLSDLRSVCTPEPVCTRTLRAARDVVDEADLYLARPLHFETQRRRVHALIACAMERRGKVVFPSSKLIEHYDDKLAQTWHLAEYSFPAPLTFWTDDRSKAHQHATECDLPMVAKLTSGAGATNVKLLPSRRSVHSFINQMFDSGFAGAPSLFCDMRTKVRNTMKLGGLLAKLRRAPATMRSILHRRRTSYRHSGYVYMQQFLASQAGDVRVTVVWDRAYVFLRANRPNDFRASGSGSILYCDPGEYPEFCAMAFRVADSLKAPMLAIDFLPSASGPIVIEYSYTFAFAAVANCPGFMTRDGRAEKGDGPFTQYFTREFVGRHGTNC